MAGALSAVANRVNLLALNLAVLVSPGAAGANVEEAGTELRSIFEEARRLSRDVGALAQRIASAARGAAERGSELASAIAEERARVERGALAIEGLDDMATRLRRAFDSIRQAGRASDEECRRLHADLALETSHAESLAATVLEDRVALESFSTGLRETAASLTQLRITAERTVRNLLAIAETASERRAPAPDGTALDSVREALKLLS
jgi:chromosome segregation ATPase